MPLRGGPSDKAGNSYESRWTVFALIDLLEGGADELRIEVPGEQGDGSEFCLTVDGVAVWHQAKRQRSAGPWTVSALVAERVVQPWMANLARGERCVLVSGTGADQLRELTDRARSARSWEEFESVFLAASEVHDNFDRLCDAWDCTGHIVYEALQLVTVRTVGEAELAEWVNDRLRAVTIGGAPATVAAVLAQLVDDSVHRVLSAHDVWAHLAQHGISPRQLNSDDAVVSQVAHTVDSFLTRLRPLFVGGQELARIESVNAFDQLVARKDVVLTGGAGSGKSVVTAQVIAFAREQGWPIMLLSADRMPDAATTADLGTELGLPDSPATVLGGIATGKGALLVIDQLDAVGLTSGRHPERFALVADLLREARSHPHLRVLVSCRQFDIANDRGLRALAHDRVEVAHLTVGDLDKEQVAQVLTQAGLSAAIPDPLSQLLRVPLHLALYVELAAADIGDLDAVRSLTELYDKYWDAKRDACRRAGASQFLPAIERLVEQMSERQELYVPQPVLDHLDEQIRVMASEGLPTVSQGRVAFFHETLFDYCFARHIVRSRDTIEDLLRGSTQDLFRRSQVRQILTFERAADFTGYIRDFTWLVNSPDVRPHIKALVIALLDTVTNPTNEEWHVLRPLAADQGAPLHNRLWQTLRRNPAWFPVLDADGTWGAMLRAGGETADRAAWALAERGPEDATRVRDLLAQAPVEWWASRGSGSYAPPRSTLGKCSNSSSLQ